MTSILSERQKDDLHKAILDYLSTNGFGKSFDQFKEESNQADFQPDSSAKTSGLLAKKWTSVIRMQKKIMELETRLAQALEDNSHIMANGIGGSSGGVGGKSSLNTDWLPTANSAKHTLTGHRGNVNAAAFHPIYSVVATASDDFTVKVWDWDSGDLERTLKSHTKRVSDCQYNSNGTTLVTCGYDLFIKLWNVENDYQNFATLRGHEHSISSARFLPGDDKIISSSRDHTLRIWDIASTHCIKVITPHDGWIRCAVPSEDGRFVITAAGDHTSKIVDVASGDVKAEFRGHENDVETAEFCPPHAVAAIRELVGVKAPTGAQAQPSSLTFAVTASRDKTIKIWDANSGQCLHTLRGHDDWIHAIVFHPNNGQYLLTAADDHTIRIWDLKTGRCTRKIEAHVQFVNSMSWGRMRMGAGSGSATNGAQGTGADKSGASADVNAGQRLVNVIATTGSDQSVKIWVPTR